MSDEVKPVECDCCGGTWGYINADGEHDNVWNCVSELTQQRDTMRRERDEARREREISATAHKIACGALAESAEQYKELRHRAERMEQAAVNVITSFISGRDCGDSPCGTGKAAGISPEFCMCRKEAREEFAEALGTTDGGRA